MTVTGASAHRQVSLTLLLVHLHVDRQWWWWRCWWWRSVVSTGEDQLGCGAW